MCNMISIMNVIINGYSEKNSVYKQSFYVISVTSFLCRSNSYVIIVSLSDSPKITQCYQILDSHEKDR